MALTKVTRSGITDDSINADKIEDGTIVDADITPGTITNAKLAGSITNAKLANSSITINGSAISLGGSVTAGKVEWQSVVVSDGSTVTTMVAGRGYFVDNNSAAGLVRLPASASAGDTIAIKDYRGNFGTNSLTIQRNSHKIQGEAIDSALSTDRASVTLVYVDTTRGWLYSNESNVTNFASAYIAATGGTVTTDGNFKIHAFTGDGTFCVTAGRGDLGVADYLVVAGGGGGGRDDGAGGGGGGFRSSHTCTALKLSITPGAIPITVGGGGSGSSGTKATAGSNSVFSTITSAGGGGGGDGNDQSPTPAMNGGSGGGQGGAGPPSPAGAVGGTGNTPPVSPPQGNPGGTGACKHNSGGGGGGANAAGSNSPPAAGPGTCNGRGGNGGAGANAIPVFGDSPKAYYPSTPNGPDSTFSGGGGGSANAQAGSGASGGGGDGKNAGSPSGVGSSANANHGGGGGGGSNHPGPRCGGAGGKGIVLIRYQFQAS